jgi:hypothetical protein
MTDEEKYDRLLKKFQQDKDFDLMQEYGRFLMRHIDSLTPKEREYNKQSTIIKSFIMKDKLPKTGEEIEALRIALALSGISVSSQTACLLNEVFKAVQQKGGKLSIEDAVRIEYDVKKRYNRIEVKAEQNSDTNPEECDATKAQSLSEPLAQNNDTPDAEDFDYYENDFEPCSGCDMPDACEDFGCAIKSGVRKDYPIDGVF